MTAEFHDSSIRLLTEEQLIAESKRRGCVVRALGSALDAPPTDVEYVKRYLDIIKAEQDSDVTMDSDVRRVKGLIREFRDQHDTPLGEALREAPAVHVKLTPKQIKHRIEQGYKVCVAGEEEVDGQFVGGHMVHLGLDNNRRFMALSDGGGKIDLANKYHRSFVFTPNGNRASRRV